MLYRIFKKLVRHGEANLYRIGSEGAVSPASFSLKMSYFRYYLLLITSYNMIP